MSPHPHPSPATGASARPPALAIVVALATALSAALSLTPSGRAGAQTTGPLPESAPVGAPYERARTLVEAGRGAEGRALVDSLLGASGAGTPAYAEALWWRATLARDGAGAERDLRTLVVEFPASPRAVDAALRLAQLELARGRPAEARERLERLRRDQPEGAPRARASYWLARAQLDAGDSRTACTTLNEAAGSALPGDPVARQVVALRRRLPGCELTVAVGSGGAGEGAERSPGPDTSAAPAAEPPSQGTDTTAPTPAPHPVAATPTPATPAAAEAPARVAAGPAWSVQLAANDRRPDADAMVARLARSGIEARVSGVEKP
ncbi:MAG: SPOR domain-containing protein, partial [Gemmatirosa sp.]